jgi:hypothetical protein
LNGGRGRGNGSAMFIALTKKCTTKTTATAGVLSVCAL